VLTGRDYVDDGLAPIPHAARLMGRSDVAARLRGFEPITTQDYPMPPDKARFVGEPVALVVAQTIDQAKDAAELLEIAYEPLPAVVRAADAVKPGAPSLWEDAPNNLCIDIEVGDEAAASTAFQRGAYIVRLDTWVQRVTGVPMEPRTTTAEYDPASGNYTLYAGSGRGVAKLRLDLALVLGVPAEQVRCVCGDMGGNVVVPGTGAGIGQRPARRCQSSVSCSTCWRVQSWPVAFACGLVPGNLTHALADDPVGTLIYA
jgi:carbon-monoxide dehydrogenase large subunit